MFLLSTRPLSELAPSSILFPLNAVQPWFEIIITELQLRDRLHFHPNFTTQSAAEVSQSPTCISRVHNSPAMVSSTAEMPLSFLTQRWQIRFHSFLFLFLCLFLVALPVNGAFTRPAQWRLGEIEQTHAGTWCYRPGPSPAHAHQCRNDTLRALLDTHINNIHGAGLSICFYDLADLSVLRGAGWANWDAVTQPVGVCMTGLVVGLENTFSTTCRFTVTDDDQQTPSVHTEECIVSRPQLRVIDGSYTPPPPRPWFRLDESTSGVLAIGGLIIALPIAGFYRCCRARRARKRVELEDGPALPPVAFGEGIDIDEASQDVPYSETAQLESSSSPDRGPI